MMEGSVGKLYYGLASHIDDQYLTTHSEYLQEILMYNISVLHQAHTLNQTETARVDMILTF